jgi:bis(5'-nucleosyl)-tetraphosphatase (symmetrical)
MKALGVRKMRKSDTIQDILALADASDWKNWLRSLPLVETSMLGKQPFAMVHASAHPEWSLDELSVLAERAQQSLCDGPFEALAEFFAPENQTDRWRDVVDRLTRCRSIDSEGFWSDELPATPEDAWHARFAGGEHDYGVVYGHWALQGLHVSEGFRGLDTGCVHHGRDHDGFLTAWLPDDASERPFDLPDAPGDRFWQIPAQRAYYHS